MRRRTRTRIWAPIAGAVLAFATLAPALSDGSLPNGGFESGTDGWAVPVGATLAVDAAIAPAEGAAAAHLTATRAGSISLASQYWTVEVTPG